MLLRQIRQYISFWYQVMINGYNSVDPIRKMFYRQLGILEDAAEKVNYRGELTRYDSKKRKSMI